MSTGVDVTGMDAIFKQIDAANKRLEEKANKAVHYAGLTCQKVAKQNCPVGTPESTGIPGYHGGRLRQSIQVDNSKRFVSTCGTNVYYGIFVDKGTVKMKARPFLSVWGYEAGKQQLQDDLKGSGI